MATVEVVSASMDPSYAPYDPSIPQPWKGLIDGSTGSLYYWNPETNITQYEKPASLTSLLPSIPKLAPIPSARTMQPSQQVPSQQQSSQLSQAEQQQGSFQPTQLHIRPQVYPSQQLQSHPYQGTEMGLTPAPQFTQQPIQNMAHNQNGSYINLSPTDMYCQKHEISVTGDNVPAPFISFQDTGFPAEILKEVHSAGFASPTPIQAQTWPIALQSKDIVAIAKTGSGKTLGYLIPAFMLLRRCRNNPRNGPTVVILAPTRELATQIQEEVLKFGRSSRISCTCLYGGAPKGPQLKELERGVEIVVATPGRLNDILEMKKVDFGQVSLFVLDEADRMLDMGFEPQIRKIVKEIPTRRQTLMYTATWPKEVKKIAGDLLVNPVQVNIGRVDELAANKSITQLVEIVPQNGKQRRLEEILRSQERGSKIIIFCSTKRQCDQLTRSIGRNFGAAAIHGDKSQGERDWVLAQFRTGKSPILVATDVAARGLDVKDIRVVVNYDFPNGVEDYVHRIGRTGRAGATGLAYTFFSDQDSKHASALIKVLEGASQAVPKGVRDIALRGGGGGARWGFGGGRGGMRGGSRGGGGYNNAGRGRDDSRREGGDWSRVPPNYGPNVDRVRSRSPPNKRRISKFDQMD